MRRARRTASLRSQNAPRDRRHPSRPDDDRPRLHGRPTAGRSRFGSGADVGELEGILAFDEQPFVSSDVIGSSYSAIVDGGLTNVVGGTQVKVVAWYDNEWGYSCRLVDLAERVSSR